MPVEFLSDDQARRYGRFTVEPSLEQLERFFTPSPAERIDIERRRSETAVLGYAVQLGTVKFLGTFLANLDEVPDTVVEHVARVFEVDPRAFKSYPTARIRFEHTTDIRNRWGYRPFGEGIEHWRFLRWLYERVWTGNERPSILLDRSTAWLIDHRVLLPGISTLTRLIARIRDRSNRRAWQRLTIQVTPAMAGDFDKLLELDETRGVTHLETLRRPPRSPSLAGLVAALDQLEQVQDLGGDRIDTTVLPASRLRALAADAAGGWAQRIARRTPERRAATLAAFAATRLESAHDDVIDVFLVVIGDLLSRAKQSVQKDRLRSLAELDAAARILAQAARVVLASDVTDSEVRPGIFAVASREELHRAIEVVAGVTSPGDGSDRYTPLLSRYPHVRRFAPDLLRLVAFDSANPSHPIIAALEHLRLVEQGAATIEDAPQEVITDAWRDHACPGSEISRRGYTMCVLDRLRIAIRRRDVFVPAADRWGDPRRLLISAETWARTRAPTLRTLGLAEAATSLLEQLGEELTGAYRQAIEVLNTDPDVWIEPSDTRDRVHVTRLDENPEPASTKELREQSRSLLPDIDLPEVLLEVDNWCGFTTEFAHISGARTRIKDLNLSICAVLVAQACNVGYRPVTRRNNPALTIDRLEWVAANYLRAETLTAANNRLVDHQSGIALVRRWGTGEVASADGMRFVVPVRSVHAGANPRYFGVGRGVTYYNWTSDQFTGWAGIVIPGTLRDSQFILDGLLDNTSSIHPHEITADTAADSDLIHGLFRLLGYRFSPRLADLPDRRYWRLDPRADYGPFNRVAVNRINTRLIAEHWDDICRVAGTLHTHAASASDLIRAIQRGGQPTTLAKAIAEIGRIVKTTTMLTYVSDEAYRRRILIQLNRQEARHSVARYVFHGRRGDLHQAYKTGQEQQLGALGLVVNAIALWNTRYLDQALIQIRHDGHPTDASDLERLSPLLHDHIQVHGRYSFTLPSPVLNGELRPLTTQRGGY